LTIDTYAIRSVLFSTRFPVQNRRKQLAAPLASGGWFSVIRIKTAPSHETDIPAEYNLLQWRLIVTGKLIKQQ
jgi:hypothetical protein